MYRALATIPLLLALGFSAGRARAEASLEAEAELGTGIDTDPLWARGASSSTGEFALALVRAKATLAGERLRLGASLAEAGRLYLSVPEATAIASRLEAAASLWLAPRLSAGTALSASDFTGRDHGLDRNSLAGEASLSWDAGVWGASLAGGWSLFAPRDASLREFLASGPEGRLRARWVPAPGHALSAGYGLWAAAYPRWTEPAGRDDRTHTISAEYAHRGEFLAAVGYAYTWNRSSARGGDYTRHRITARGATYLPLDLTLAARASLQWSHYPEPLTAQQLLLSQGQGNQNTLEARLTRPLGSSLELSLAFAIDAGEDAGGSAPSYLRTVLSAALGWRGAWRRP